MTEERDILHPYYHDCDECRWVGWFSPYADKVPMNVYLCRDTVIIRFSSEGSDYWSARAEEGIKGPISISTDAIALVEERKQWFKEE